MKMKIELTSDVPVCIRSYKMPFARRAVVTDIVKELLGNEIIRESDSCYAAGVVLVEKKNGEQRLCVDYRSYNKLTLKVPFPMPVMEELLAQPAGNSYFTTLDMRMG